MTAIHRVSQAAWLRRGATTHSSHRADYDGGVAYGETLWSSGEASGSEKGGILRP